MQTPSRRDFLKTVSLGVLGTALVPAIRAGSSVSPGFAIEPKVLRPGERIGIGIVGCGARSKAHATAVKSVPEFEVRGLCDLLPETIAERQEQIGGMAIRSYTDYRKLLADPEIDAIFVITPNDSHREITIAAFEAGKHVLCEKPMALHPRECDEMIAAQARAKRALMIGTQRRHAPGRVEFVKRVHEGAIGRPLYAWMQDFRRDWRRMFTTEEEEIRKNWRYSDRRSGGLTFEMSIHGIDWCNWILDSDPVEVVGMGGLHNPLLRKRDSTDHIGFCVRYANGSMLNYGASLYSSGGYGPDVISGTEGSAFVVGDTMHISRADYGQSTGVPGKLGTETIKLKSGSGLVELHRRFAESIQGKSVPYPDGFDGRRGVLIARAAEMSFVEKRLVRISEFNGA